MTTGRPLANLCARIIAHLTVILACVLAVIFACDVYTRGEMGLLNNDLTRWMLLALCVLAAVTALTHLRSLARLRTLRRYFDLTDRRD